MNVRIYRGGHDPEHIWERPRPELFKFNMRIIIVSQVLIILTAAFRRQALGHSLVHRLFKCLSPLFSVFMLCIWFILSVSVSNILSVCSYMKIYEKCVFVRVYCICGILEFLLVQIQSQFGPEPRAAT